METVVSKTSTLFNIKVIGIGFFWVMFILMSLSYSFSHYDFSSSQIVYLFLLTAALIGIGVYKINKGIVAKIMVSREDITVYFIITKRQLIIKHTDVKAIYDLHGSAGRQGRMFDYRTQELELNDGSSIEFTDAQFTNYNELKAKLWEYRLLAYEELRAAGYDV